MVKTTPLGTGTGTMGTSAASFFQPEALTASSDLVLRSIQPEHGLIGGRDQGGVAKERSPGWSSDETREDVRVALPASADGGVPNGQPFATIPTPSRQVPAQPKPQSHHRIGSWWLG